MPAQAGDCPSAFPGVCLKHALALVAHCSYLLTLAMLMVVSITILLPLLPFGRLRRTVASALLRRYLRFFALRWLPFLRVYRLAECAGLERLPGKAPAIIVANHRSSMDALLLLALLPPTALVIKARHARKPGYAFLVRFFDFVSMESGAPSAIRHSMDKCKALLSAGMNLLVFPEGFRVSASRSIPFAELAFRLAVDHGTALVPVVIHSDRPVLNRQAGSYLPAQMVNFRIRVLEPVDAAAARDAGQLSDTVSQRMRALLCEWDNRYLQPTS
jgi:1-acyl-sn-glycerol-3-phosphate acyltransferase